MNTTQLTLTAEERAYLQRTLESALLEKQRELTHTSTSEFRAFVRHEEELLRDLVTRLHDAENQIVGTRVRV